MGAGGRGWEGKGKEERRALNTSREGERRGGSRAGKKGHTARHGAGQSQATKGAAGAMEQAGDARQAARASGATAWHCGVGEGCGRE